MTLARHFATVSAWLEIVAGTIVAALDRVLAVQKVQLVEQDANNFLVRPGAGGRTLRLRIGEGVSGLTEELAALLRGSQVEVVLRPQLFLFRPLQLPRQAGEFLAGIVRAQIDRLTPWSANEAVFGWSNPADAGAERIAVTVAATGRAAIEPYMKALATLGARSLTIFAAAPDASAGDVPIRVLEHDQRRLLDIGRIRRILTAVLLVAIVTAAAAGAADIIIGGGLDADRAELARKIAARRFAIRAGSENRAAALDAQGVLDRRKHATTPTVLVLEALSQILPDDTYVTELRIEADKLRVIGLTRQAPSLIRLIEQSPQFTHATFFAPTTRSPGDPGERFNIEAHIEPVFQPPS
jgi:general secretion pathway protein L